MNNCNDPQCRQVHDLLNAILSLLQIETCYDQPSATKAIRIAGEINGLKGHIQSLKESRAAAVEQEQQSRVECNRLRSLLRKHKIKA